MPINIQQALNYRFSPDAINQAKQMGWNDSQINAYKQQVFSDLTKQNAVEAATQAQQQQSQNQDKGNFLTHLLPSGGGIAGSLGGAAAGAALGSVVPVVGTGIGALLGGILGGAGGSALGKVGENAVEGNSDLGQGVGQEALMGGITGVPLGSALKIGQAGFKAVTGVGKAGIGDLLAQAGEKAIPGQIAAKTAGQTVADAGNATTQAGVDAMGRPLNQNFLQKLGGSLQDTGTNQLVKNQVNVTRAGQARINGGDIPGLFKTMQNNYGLNNLNDMNQVGALVTGKAGLDNGGAALTNAVEQAVMSGKGINADDLKTLLQGRIDQAGAAINPGDIKALQSQVAQAQKSMYDQTAAQAAKQAGGAATSPTNLVDPLVALQQARALGGNASTFLERNPNIITSRDQALGNIYSGLSSDIKDRLFNTQGALGQVGAPITADAQGAVNEAVTALRGEAQKYIQAGNKSVGNAINKVADQAAGAKTLSDLNAIQAPFVNASKLSDINGLGGGGAAGKVGGIQDTATGMLNSVAGDLIQPGMNGLASGLTKVGGKISNIGNSMAGAGGAAAAAGGQNLRGGIARALTERGLAGDFNNTQAPQDPSQQDPMAASGIDPSQGMAMDPSAQQPQDNAFGGLTQTDVQSAMVQAVKAGDTKALANLKLLNDAMTANAKASQASGNSGIGKPSAQQNSLAQSGLGALSQLQQLIQQDPSVVSRAAIPGQQLPIVGGLISNAAGTGTYQSLGQNVVDAIARARTGAAMSKSEEAFYNRMLPQPGDSKQTIQTKMAQLQQAFEPFMAQKNSGPDLSSLLGQYAQ